MKDQSAPYILNSRIESLNLSPEFKLMAEVNRLVTLTDLLKTPMHKFPDLPQSGYRLLRELVNFLDEHGLTHLAKN